MKLSTWFKSILLGILAGLAVWGTPLAQQYILETANPADLARVTSHYALTLVRTIRSQPATICVVTLPPGASGTDVATIQTDELVRQFLPDVEVDVNERATVSRSSRPLDPLSDALTSPAATNYYGVPVRSGYVQQNAASLIQLALTQQQFPTGNVTVAVIDTGVDPQHPALAGVLTPGYDFLRDLPGIPSELAGLSQSTVAILDQSTVAILDQKNTPLVLNQSTVAILDQSTVAILDGSRLPFAFGHGTMVSGLIHLVAPTARIMPLRAFQLDGTANLSDVIRAIYYAVDHNARVINMSFSTSTDSPELSQAVSYAVSRGVILIAAAGNNGREMRVYPGGYRGVYGTGSTDKLDLRSPFSNYGDAVSIAAPGEALVTTYPGNNYAAVWGTSFSTPLVSGAAALLATIKPSLQPGQLTDIFEQGVRIGQDMGDARLDVLSSMLYCARQSYSKTGDH